MSKKYYRECACCGHLAPYPQPRGLKHKLEEARRLLEGCLHTGGLRTDNTRQLYIDVCNWLGIVPE